jgi:hypothetical protein
MPTTEPTHKTTNEERRDARLAASTHRTSGEILEASAPFVEFAAAETVRTVEVAAVVLRRLRRLRGARA